MGKVLQLLMDRIDTPLGELLIVADEDGNLRSTVWADYETRLQPSLELHYGKNGFTLQSGRHPSGLTEAIRRYFAGDLTAIDLAGANCRHPFSARGVASVAGNSLWHDSFLRHARRANRPAKCRQGGGLGQRFQSGWHCSALPPRDWIGWFTHGLW